MLHTTVKVEEEAAHISVVDFAASVRLVLSNHLYHAIHHVFIALSLAQ